MYDIQKSYKIKIEWTHYLINLAIHIFAILIIITPLVERYSEEKWIFIAIGLFFIFLRLMLPLIVFGYAVKLNQVTLEITEEFFGFVYRKIDIQEITGIYYGVIKYASGYSAGARFFSEINRPVNVELITNDNHVLRRKWFIIESDLFDMIKDLREIGHDIEFFTNEPDYKQQGLKQGQSFDNRSLHKERHSKYFPLYFILGLVIIFIWLVLLIKFMDM